jgi:hypothetical protein
MRLHEIPSSPAKSHYEYRSRGGDVKPGRRRENGESLETRLGAFGLTLPRRLDAAA